MQSLLLDPDAPTIGAPSPASISPVELDRPPVRRSPWWGRGALLALLLAFGMFAFAHASAGMTEPDDNGYFAQASLLMTTGHTWFGAVSDAQYIGMHWLLMPDGNYVSRYPPGLPVLIGVVYAIGGWKACAFVNPALATAALAGLYVAARRITGTGWALAAVVLLATNPTFVRHALAMDSHMAVACCLTWGVALLLTWRATGKRWQLFLAGLMLGCIPTVRYPDSIVALGVAVFLLANWRAFPKIWQHYAAAIGGAMVPILPLLIRNQLLLGGFWRTGYSLTNEQTGFGWNYFSQHFVAYVQTVNGEGLGLAFALGLVGLTLMCCLRGTRAIGALLALSTLPILLLYMAYYWGPQGNAAMTMRFLVPTFPLYVLASVWTLATMTRFAPRAAKVALPIVVVMTQLAWGLSTAGQNAQQMAENKRRAAMLTDEVVKDVPAGAVVVANGSVQQQLDFVRHWRLADLALMTGRGGGPGGPGGGGGMGGPGGPLGGFANMMGGPPDGGGGPGGPMGMGGMGGNGESDPSPQQKAKTEHLRSLYPTEPDARAAKFVKDVATWSAGQPIYLVGTESELKTSFDARAMKIVGRVTLPASQQPAQTGRGMMGGGGMGGPGGGMRGNVGGGGFGNRGGGGGGGMRGGPGGGGGPMMGVQAGDYVIAVWTPR